MSSFQIQLYSHTSGLPGFTPCTAQVADFVENSPLQDSPQHTESGIGLEGIGTARINCRRTGSTSGWSVPITHSLLSVMKCDTLREASISELFVISSRFAKISLAH